MKAQPAPGDKVAVSIGTDEVLGTVLEVYGPERAPMALVELPFHGSTGSVLGTRTASFAVTSMRQLHELTIDELRALLRRYRPVAAAIAPGQLPPSWDWDAYPDVHRELQHRGLSDADIDELAWGWRAEDDE